MTVTQGELFPHDRTIGEERARIIGVVMKGGVTSCACCTRRQQLYKRGIHCNLARWLIQLARRYTRFPRWYSVNERWSLIINNHDHGKLEAWDLAVRKPVDVSEDKKSSGYWKPTQLGIDFAFNRVQLPKKKKIYLNVVYGEIGPEISIKSCLDAPFSYQELMEIDLG